ncbi:hypothetical protein F7C95_07280 [Opitutia bacterium ISCC 51]|nr:hypothetical protein F7C95_07280 [Opitutae bacterium ISCC 51]QXD29753.1 hypothetical protein GA003_07240 [Opitutae bacterium ISCC 52]
MRNNPLLLTIALSCFTLFGGDTLSAELVFTDSFDRPDGSKTEDAPGNGWTTNSAWRADGKKQVYLKGGALEIRRLEHANHAVSFKHNIALGDCTISMRFKIGEGDRLGVNFNDNELKTAHAGHVCTVRVTNKEVSVADQMNGSMNLELRKRRQAGETSPELKQLIAKTEKKSPIHLKPDTWHELMFELDGDIVRVFMNDTFQLEHRSPGFAHPTKSNIAISVPKNLVMDDFKVWNRAGKK